MKWGNWWWEDWGKKNSRQREEKARAEALQMGLEGCVWGQAKRVECGSGSGSGWGQRQIVEGPVGHVEKSKFYCVWWKKTGGSWPEKNHDFYVFQEITLSTVLRVVCRGQVWKEGTQLVASQGKKWVIRKVEVAAYERRMMLLAKGDPCLDSGLFTCCSANSRRTIGAYELSM